MLCSFVSFFLLFIFIFFVKNFTSSVVAGVFSILIYLKSNTFFLVLGSRQLKCCQCALMNLYLLVFQGRSYRIFVSEEGNQMGQIGRKSLFPSATTISTLSMWCPVEFDAWNMFSTSKIISRRCGRSEFDQKQKEN